MRNAFLAVVVLSVLTVIGCQVDGVVIDVPEPITESGEYEGEYLIELEDGTVYTGKMTFHININQVDTPPSLPDDADADVADPVVPIGVTVKVNINTANPEALHTLPGIGVVKAAAIIAYRLEHDGFDSIEELVNVKGIGPKTMDNLRVLITVG